MIRLIAQNARVWYVASEKLLRKQVSIVQFIFIL